MLVVVLSIICVSADQFNMNRMFGLDYLNSQENISSIDNSTFQFFGQHMELKPLIADREYVIPILKSIYNSSDEGSIFGNDNYTAAEDNMTLECLLGFQNLTTNLLRFPFWNMIDSSLNSWLQIGNDQACQKIGIEEANYVIVELYLNYASYKIGMCIPSVCTDKEI